MEILKNKKIIIIFSIIILLVIGVIWKVNYDNSRKYEIEQVTSIDYLLLVEEGRCGVIDRYGNIVVSPIYDDIQIPNPSKPLFICMSNYNEENQQYDITVLNEKSERILYEYITVEAVYMENSTSVMPYEKSVLKYKQDGKWGLIDFEGKKITKPIYESIDGLESREGLLKVRQNSKYGIINIKGTTIIKPNYDNIKSDGYYSDNGNYNSVGFIVSNTTNEGYRYGYINAEGKELFKVEYNEIMRITEKKDDENAYLLVFKNGMGAVYKNKKALLNHEYEDIFYNEENDLLIVQKNSKQGVMNLEGNIIVPIEYSNINISGKFINALTESELEVFDLSGNNQNIKGYISISETENEEYNIAITIDDEYVIIDNKGNIITNEKYQNIKSFDAEKYIVRKNNKYGVIDINENIKVDYIYDIMQVLPKTNIIQGLNIETSITELYDKDMNKILTVKNANIYIEESYIKVISENNVQYYDYNGNQLKNTQIFDNTLYAIEQDGKWGFSDKDGNIIIEPKYEMVTEFNDYGFAGIKQDGKWGSINQEGIVIIEPVYELTENQPDFIGQYHKVDYGYGTLYYTNIFKGNE